MEYMEQKMQEYMEAGEHRPNELLEQMAKFEDFYLAMPDADPSLISEKVDYFDYVDEYVQSMWVSFRANLRKDG